MLLSPITTVICFHLSYVEPLTGKTICTFVTIVFALFVTLSNICRPQVLGIGSSGTITRGIGHVIPRKHLCSCQASIIRNGHVRPFAMGFCLNSQVIPFSYFSPNSRKCMCVNRSTIRPFGTTCNRRCDLRSICSARRHDYSSGHGGRLFEFVHGIGRRG